MKKLLFLLLALLIASRSSTIAQSDIPALAKQQIIDNIQLPIKAEFASPWLIKQHKLDTIVIKIKFDKNNRVSSVTFPRETYFKVNNAFKAVAKRLKFNDLIIPKNTELVIGFKLDFINVSNEQYNNHIIARSNSTSAFHPASSAIASAPAKPLANENSASMSHGSRMAAFKHEMAKSDSYTEILYGSDHSRVEVQDNLNSFTGNANYQNKPSQRNAKYFVIIKE